MTQVNNRNQTGAALVVGLLLLTVLALLSVFGMTRATLQERLSGGVRNSTMAHYGAEAALRDAEFSLYDFMARNGRKPSGNDGPFWVFESDYAELDLRGTSEVVDFRGGYGWSGSSNAAAYRHGFDAAADGKLARNPQIMIELLGPATTQDHLQFDTYGGQSGTSSSDPSAYTDTLNYYRITARSTGGSENLVKVLESTFAITD